MSSGEVKVKVRLEIVVTILFKTGSLGAHTISKQRELSLLLAAANIFLSVADEASGDTVPLMQLIVDWRVILAVTAVTVGTPSHSLRNVSTTLNFDMMCSKGRVSE